jgi:hypothetical protein
VSSVPLSRFAKSGQRSAAFALGAVLALVSLEGGLRLGARVFLATQQQSRHQETSKLGHDVVRVVCIGESTTALGGADSFPSQLETALDRIGGRHRFEVINQAIPGIDSGVMADRLSMRIDALHPDVVVSMLGANDGADATIPRGAMSVAGQGMSAPSIWESSKVWKLVRQLQLDFRRRQEALPRSPQKDLVVPPGGARRLPSAPPTTQPDEDGSIAPFQIALAVPELSTNIHVKCEPLSRLMTELLGSPSTRPTGTPHPVEPHDTCEAVELLLDAAEAGKTVELVRGEGRAGGPARAESPDFPIETFTLAGDLIMVAHAFRHFGREAAFFDLWNESLSRRDISSRYCLDLGDLLERKGGGWLARGLFERSVSLAASTAEEAEGHRFLARELLAEGLVENALHEALMAVDQAPGDFEAILVLATCYRSLGRNVEAATTLEAASSLASGDTQAQLELVTLQEALGRCEDADFHAQVEASGKAPSGPAESEIGWRLAMCDAAMGRDASAENRFRQAWDSSGSPWSFRLLLEFFDSRSRHDEARDLLAGLGDPKSLRPCFLDRAIDFYDRHDNSALAALYQEKGSYLSAPTRANYLRINTLLTSRGIPLVAVQYPLRSASALQRAVPKGVPVVDNDAPFEKAVLDEGYDAIFWDACYGDFGHATRRGNELLARNVAPVVLGVLGM